MIESVEQRQARLVALESGAARFVPAVCRRCAGANEGIVLAVPESADAALCTVCIGTSPAAGILAGQYSPVVGYPMPFGMTPRPEPEPAELVTPAAVCDPDCAHPVPAPVRSLAEHARSHDWLFRVRHSVGRVVGGTGKQLAEAQMWSVAFRRGDWGGYAVRRGDAWSSVCVVGVDLPPFLKLGVTGLKEWLEQPDREAGWYAEVVAREAAQALAAKIVKCPGPGVCPWLAAGNGDHTHRANGDIRPKTSRAGAEKHGR